MSAEEIVKHLDNGGTVACSGSQSIVRQDQGQYYLSCNDPGCCDELMDLTSLLRFIEYVGGNDWSLI